jgi:hypothetical protein
MAPVLRSRTHLFELALSQGDLLEEALRVLEFWHVVDLHQLARLAALHDLRHGAGGSTNSCASAAGYSTA